MAKVFIGMPVYNGEQFLEEAIGSLLNQTFTDLELLISDDSSTDGTELICNELKKKDVRIRYLRHEKNIGMFNNFGFTLNQAKGDYFMWACQDDIWEKDFIKVCVENISSKKVDATITTMADVDSYGRNLRELTEVTKLSGHPEIRQVSKYVLQPEILGKCNLMYCLFKLETIKKVWEIYPQRMEWGSDYQFSLALISHFAVYVDKQILFKKRHGGFSSPDAIKNDDPGELKRIVIKNPKNHMFPFGRFRNYLRGHMEALAGTPYRPLVVLLLLLRLPRALFIHLTERNYRKFFKLKTFL